jgi:hypothetical protein
MSPDKIIQIQNEVFTKIIMDELQRQKKAGTERNNSKVHPEHPSFY